MDNLLEHESGGAGIDPEAIIEEVMVEGEGPLPPLDNQGASSSEEISGVESDLSDDEGDVEDLEDNFNSAGEEVRE